MQKGLGRQVEPFTKSTFLPRLTKRFGKARCQAHSKEEQQCRRTAEQAVDAFVESNSTVGVGHGRMGIYTLESLADRLHKGLLQNISCVTSSEIASVEAAVHGIPLRDLQDPKVEVAVSFVEADELDHSGAAIQFITGRAELSSDGTTFQQPPLTQLKRLLGKSKSTVALVSSEEKIVSRLGGTLPVVISSEDWERTAEDIDDLFIGDAEIWRRSRDQNANPRGGNHPYMSPEGHSIVDIKFITTLKLNGENVPYGDIRKAIEEVSGVITTGLFMDITTAAIFPRGDEAKIIEKGLILGFKDSQ